jgi:hypothetical protein
VREHSRGDRWVAVFGRLFGIGLRTKQADQGRPHPPALPTPSLLFVPPLRHTKNPRCLPIFAREKYDTINVASAISATDVTTTWTLLRFHQPDTRKLRPPKLGLLIPLNPSYSRLVPFFALWEPRPTQRGQRHTTDTFSPVIEAHFVPG